MVWLYNCCVFKNGEGGNSWPFPGEGDKFFTLVGRGDKREGGRLRKKEMERLIQVIEHDLVIPEVQVITFLLCPRGSASAISVCVRLFKNWDFIFPSPC